MIGKKALLAALVSAALVLPAGTVQARGTTNQTKATIAGAAAGAAVGAAMGKDARSAVIGATIGGLAGNAYAYHNKKMEASERDRHYYEEHRYKHKKYKKKYHKRKKHRDWDDDDDD